MKKIREYLRRIAEAVERIADALEKSNNKSQPDPPGT